MLIRDVLRTMVNNKLYENGVTVKLVPRTSWLFDMLNRSWSTPSISKDNECW